MTLIMCLDWWVWELMAFLAGYFTVDEQASMIILTNIDLFMFMTSRGFEIGSCALVGNAIGSGNP